MSRSDLSSRDGALAFLTRRGQHRTFWQLEEEFQESWSVGTGGERMGQGLRGHWGLGSLTQAFVSPSISCLRYSFKINMFLWNKMGNRLKVIIPILALHYKLPPSDITWKMISHVLSPPPSLAHVRGVSLTDTGIQVHSGWARGLENTDWLCSGGIRRLTWFLLCSTSGSRIREFFLEDRFIYNLEIIALSSGSVNYYYQWPVTDTQE